MMPQCGKKYRMVVELTLNQTSHHAGMDHRAPIVTLEFVKRLLLLSFMGNVTENSFEGMQPFVLFIVDHRSQQTCVSIQIGQDEADDYDLSTSGEATTPLDDSRALRGPTRANAQLDITHAKSKLESISLVLRIMLVSDHPLIINAPAFMQ
jgi:hypothetical protein